MHCFERQDTLSHLTNMKEHASTNAEAAKNGRAWIKSVQAWVKNDTVRRLYKEALRPGLIVAIVVFGIVSWSGDLLAAVELGVILGGAATLMIVAEKAVPWEKAEEVFVTIALPLLAFVFLVGVIGGILSWIMPKAWAIGTGAVITLGAFLAAFAFFQKAMRKADEDL